MKTKEYLPEITLKYKNDSTYKVKITSSLESVELLRKLFDNDTIELCESFIVVYLSRSNETIGWFKVSQGGISGTVVDNKLIMATALKCGASRILLAHNHPSGNTTPSEQDKRMTDKIKHGAQYFDITVLDHIILTSSGYYSFADKNEL